MTSEKAVLFVVATPIGNLEDISLRAIRILGEADVIACEDTRKTGLLLSRHGIKRRRLTSYHKYNEAKRTAELLRLLREGKSVALVSNAGTPGVSDPGERLLRAAVQNEIRVEVLPGPSAVTAALSVSRLPKDEFVFCGFTPSRQSARKKKFASLKEERRTIVFFETANRLAASLADMLSAFGERRVEIARELTKMHEEVIRSTLSEAATSVEDKPLKGEIVLVVEGARDTAAPVPDNLREQVQRLTRELGVSMSEAVRLLASAKGIKKQDIYRQIAEEEKRKA